MNAAHLNDHAEDHDRGLAYDLETIASRTIVRRRALAWLFTAGTTALVTGCGGGSASSGSTETASGSTTASTGAGAETATTATTTAPTASGSTGQCVADPAETNGPYPADGTNTSRGATSNALTVNGIVRSDIRSSFLTSTAAAPGVQVTLTLTVVDVNKACAPLAGYAIYLWHCDRDGNYSLYDLPAESYLRGLQVTDANGQVTFTTIFPGCYAGRYPHIHFEVFTSMAAATNGRSARLISQLALPSSICTTVYNNAAGYTASISRFAQLSIANDNVFGDNSAAQVAAMTLAATGSVSAGFTATAIVGIAV